MPATTYISGQDLDTALEGFITKYYGSNIDGAEEITIGTQYGVDMGNSYSQTNEWLSGVNHIKTIPFGTQSDGNYPYHVRMLQANLMIYNRLKSAHYGEFDAGIPGWINTYLTRANEILSDIREQKAVFADDTTQGESGIGIGTYVTHSGAANWYTNWETGFYWASDFAKTYSIVIDGTTGGNSIGDSTYKWSKNGGVSFEETGQTTATTWTEVEAGLFIRWEPNGTSNQLEYGDRFDVRCVPSNIAVKSGGVRPVTFGRG
jgi:hypothetical protein